MLQKLRQWIRICSFPISLLLMGVLCFLVDGQLAGVYGSHSGIV